MYRFRNICLAILVSGSLPFVRAQSQEGAFGALDVIIRGSDDVPSAGALDVISRGVESVSPSGALDVVISSKPDVTVTALEKVVSGEAGEFRPGVLAYISRCSSGSGYYASGVWEQASRSDTGSAVGAAMSVWGDRYYQAPQWGKITSGFGYRPRFGRMHKGIDIAMSVGDTVCAPLPGVIERVAYEAGGYGHYVIVKHDDGLETRYAHLSATLVAPGDRVAAYQPLALSGNTGNSTGPHLHFETRVGGTAVDPRNIFDFAGSLMTPRYGGIASNRPFTAVASGALERVSRQGSSGKSLYGKRTYVVRAGDTLQSIAARAGTSVLLLCQLNFISESDPLQPGRMLRIQK